MANQTTRGPTRRGFLAGAAGLPLMAAGARADAPVPLRMTWWGGRGRAERTAQANRLFMANNPRLSVAGDWAEWDSYWPKLAGRIRSGGAPDLLQMDVRYIAEYSHQQLIRPLDGFIANGLRLQDFPLQAVEDGRVDGKLFGVVFGATASATLFNRSAFQAAAQDPPDASADWEKLAQLAAKVAAARPGASGLADAGGRDGAYEIFLRQRGKALFHADGALGFGAGDARDWLAMWDGFRRKNLATPVALLRTDRYTAETSPLSRGKAMMDFNFSNQLIAHQAETSDQLGLAPPPRAGDGPGAFLRPAMYLSIAATSAHTAEALKLLNFFVSDPLCGRLCGVGRGVPASASVRMAVVDGVDDTERETVDYINSLIAHVDKLLPPPLPPRGAGDLAIALRAANLAVAEGKSSPSDAAQAFTESAQAALARA